MFESVRPENREAAQRVVAAVRREFRVTDEHLLSESRSQPLREARAAAAFVLREVHRLPWHEISAIFGRDMSSSRKGCQSLQRRLKTDPELRRRVEAVWGV